MNFIISELYFNLKNGKKNIRLVWGISKWKYIERKEKRGENKIFIRRVGGIEVKNRKREGKI